MAKRGSKDKEIEDIKNRLARTLADYSNLQKRVEEEKKVLVKFANANLLIKFLVVLDSLEEAAKHVQDEGLDLSIRKFKEVLASEGVKEIEAEGKDFDPNLHEAVDLVEGKEDGKVVEVLGKGYAFEDKVLRPVRVKVTKRESVHD